MLALFFSIIALAVGPLVHHLFHTRPQARAALEGFILAAIGGLVLFHLFPACVEQGGWICIAPALTGFLGPEIFERLLHRTAHGVHQLALALALLGLLVHASIDGVALAGGAAGQLTAGIAVALVLHRIPVGLTIWWLLQRPGHGGTRLPLATLSLVTAATLAGFMLGDTLLGRVSSSELALFQALVAGTLLHVVLHQPHADAPDLDHEHQAWLSLPRILGGLLGLALVVALSLFH